MISLLDMIPPLDFTLSFWEVIAIYAAVNLTLMAAVFRG